MRASVYGRQSRNKDKSIEEQLDAGAACADDQSWTLVTTYRDGRSASRFASKQRDEWAQLLADVVAERLDVLILWESSRGDRTAETWLGFLSDCRAHRVRIHVISHDRTYDLTNARDWKTLAEDGIANAYESELISVRVRRGQGGSARQGRPSHGNAPYGYRRTYDPTTGALVGQEPHPDQAPIVRDIITRLAQGDPVSAVVRDLNARNVPTATARRWYRARVRDLATNRAYVGLRVYNGETYPGDWPALVDAETFWAAQAVLTAPGRTVTRPGRQKHLLSYYATCTGCDGPLCAAGDRYRCLAKSCTSTPREPADKLTEELVIERLTDPEVYAALKQAGEDAAGEAAAAEAQVQELSGRLGEWRRSAAKGTTTPESLAVIEAEIAAELTAARAKAARAAVPAALEGWLGRPRADVEARWANAGVPARRAVLRALGLRVRLLPGPNRGNRPVPARNRLDWEWVGEVR